MALAFANIGLAGKAVGGSRWAKHHRPKLLKQLVGLLTTQERPAGLLLNEVGNLSEVLDAQQRDEFNALLTEAFAKAGASEHGNPRIIWSYGETVAAFRAELAVTAMPPLTFNAESRVGMWRVAERFQVFGAP